ncbi:MAG: ATP-binding protein [Marinoscillum sp.]
MKSATNRLIATTIGTILLPLIIYTIYEISSVKEGEEVIEKIYRDQLDAIIFSVNQFSNDNLNGLLSKVEEGLNENLGFDEKQPYLYYSNLHTIILEEVLSGQTNIIRLVGDSTHSVNWLGIRDSILHKNQDLKEQLLRYKEGGYRKIEPRGSLRRDNEDFQVIHAMLEHSGKKIFFTGYLSIRGFAENVLAPKLQQIAEGELIITLGYRDSTNYVYVTDFLSKEVMLRKSMWIFPDLDVGISSANKTVTELVNERTELNLLAAFLLIILLILGFTLVIRNVQREIKLAQTKSDFVSNVSHELRTPLSLISMFAETLLLDRVTSHEKRKEYEEIIFKETNRLTNIVNKILNFSQMEASKRTYHPTQVDINALVNDLLHDYVYHIERNGFTHEVNLMENIPSIQIDKDALYEALVNLLDNGIKYSPNEKYLAIRTGHREDRVWVEIEDHGIGIPSELIKQIFDKFYRVTEGNVHTTRGAGLGLALVSHIVNSHGGDIEVESTPGKGSIFRMVFYLNGNGKDTNSRR